MGDFYVVDSRKVVRTRLMLRELWRDEIVEFLEKMRKVDIEGIKKDGTGEGRVFSDICHVAKRLANYSNAYDVLDEFVTCEGVGSPKTSEEVCDYIATGTIGNLM